VLEAVSLANTCYVDIGVNILVTIEALLPGHNFYIAARIQLF